MLHRIEYAQDVYDTIRAVRNPPKDGGLVRLQEQSPELWDFFNWLVDEGYTE